MPRPESSGRRGRAVALLAVCAAAAASAAARAAEPAPYRYQAAIAIDAAAPFIELALPPAAYAHLEQDELRDLRIVDARGERVPFALLPPQATVQLNEQVRAATLYPLPTRPAAGGEWPSPLDVVVDGDRISVHRHAATPAAAPPRSSGGWLIDSGEATRGEPAPKSLRLRWSGPAEFSVGYRLETSADLRTWRGGGSGQLMALQSASGALLQPVVAAAGGWRPLRATALGRARCGPGAHRRDGARRRAAAGGGRQHARARLHRQCGAASSAPRGGDAAASARAVHLDLGGVLPLVDVDLRFAAGTHVAPVRVQARTRLDAPWREVGGGVFYRVERDGEVGRSPPIALPVTARYLRFVPDERAASLANVPAQLVVHASLASLVFAAQGEPPFRLLAGSADAPPGALPVTAVVPQLDVERPRFGRATLGAFSADAAGERAAVEAERQARWRPWLLWAVLLAGVAGLGALVVAPRPFGACDAAAGAVKPLRRRGTRRPA